MQAKAQQSNLRPDGRPSEVSSCFAIMPISDHPDYPPGHFAEVYESIIAPAAEFCGYTPIRGDHVPAANLIHLDILTRILQAPMAICDLSSANPNVMFELGIRQAFDKPVVLIKDNITRKIFDIDSIRTITYDVSLRPRATRTTIEALSSTIVATRDAKPGEGINSIVGLMGLQAAALKSNDEDPSTARISLVEGALENMTSMIKSIQSQPNQLSSTAIQQTSNGIVERILSSGINAEEFLKHYSPREQAQVDNFMAEKHGRSSPELRSTRPVIRTIKSRTEQD